MRAALPLLALALFVYGCGASSSETPARHPNALLDARFTSEGFFVQSIDVNGDGTADITKYYVTLDEDGEVIADPSRLPLTSGMERRIVRREIDTNVDGRVDVVRYYDEFEDLEREELDRDFDGRLDCVNTYNEGLLSRKEIDADSDGNVEEIRYYRGGGLHRIEVDPDDDGRIEDYVYYSADQLERLGFDDNGDAEIDRWINAYDAQLATVEGSGAPAAVDEVAPAEPETGTEGSGQPAVPELEAEGSADAP